MSKIMWITGAFSGFGQRRRISIRRTSRLIRLPTDKPQFHDTVDPAATGYETIPAMGDRLPVEVIRTMRIGDILSAAQA